MVRQQKPRRVKDCKALAGEYVTTQNKPVVFEARVKKWKEKRTMGPKNINLWKCKDDMMVKYREGVRRKYEELDAEKGTVEGEWRQYKDAFVGVAEELCGRTSGKGGTQSPRSRNQGWWTEDVAKALGEKRKAWDMIECIKNRGDQPTTNLNHLYCQKKKATRRAVDIARRSMDEELYRKLDEDGGKHMIFKMARDRTEDGREGRAVR